MSSSAPGRRRRSILPSLSSLLDFETSSSKAKKGKPSLSRASTMTTLTTMQAFHSNEASETLVHSPEHDDSIEEMASMLLDVTTIDQLKADPGKRLSQVSFSAMTNEDNDLPPNASMLFDSAWVRHSSPVPTASNSQMYEFSSSEDELATCPPPIAQKRTAAHLRKSSAPAIPRRSSKRKSGRSKSSFSSPQKVIGHSRNSHSAHKLSKSISTPNQLMNMSGPAAPSRSVDASVINGKIQAMLEATNALKPVSESALNGPSIAAKKRRLKDNKVLSKMKAAFNDRLGSRSGKKSHDTARDDRLLDMSINGLPEHEDEATLSALTTNLEIRLNEGQNLKQHEKLKKMTGHGQIQRKAVAEDGKSLRSRQSHERDDPFSERPSLSQRRLTTSFEHRLKSEVMTPDQQTVPDLPKIPRSLATMPLLRRNLSSPTAYDTDFDFFSSSPEGQSTPRMRLEPRFEENGKKTLQIAPTEAPSMFDADTTMGGQFAQCDEPQLPLRAQQSQDFQVDDRVDVGEEVISRLSLLEQQSVADEQDFQAHIDQEIQSRSSLLVGQQAEVSEPQVQIDEPQSQLNGQESQLEGEQPQLNGQQHSLSAEHGYINRLATTTPDLTVPKASTRSRRRSSKLGGVSCKKHPSPSKNELESYEATLARWLPDIIPLTPFELQAAAAAPEQSVSTPSPPPARHPNDDDVAAPAHSSSNRTSRASERLSRAIDSTTNLSRFSHQRFSISSLTGLTSPHATHSRQNSRQSVTLADDTNDSRMETDELQMDVSAYNLR